ncbi:hypothetical protein CQA53_04865 [Helicobacter didelphidarum]|uniref:Uncharacterized protein n=1 Tax=Helicobacter didelphidarum TaxID=2040648 RepID=A0A3D8ILZ8_9HELI|nr:hypothetical protein [Helicobacter didelphidarum]RDU65956.1 hypothetical protein CQA53_04865 [Helicobacter didelphidarum]
MLILSRFTTNQRFQEIVSFADCKTIDSDICIFFKIEIYNQNLHSLKSIDEIQDILESKYLLAKELQMHEMHYAVYMYIPEYFPTKLQQEIKRIFLLFTQFGAQYFIIKSNLTIAYELQKVANYYLTDTKILAVVLSHNDCLIGKLAYFNSGDSDFIGIDGVIEEKILESK